MKNLSVILNGVSNRKRFLNDLFTETGNEITADMMDNEVLFYNLDEAKSKNLLKALAKNILNEYEKKMLVKIINENCDYFSKKDKYEIWKLGMCKLLDDEAENNDEYITRLKNVESKLDVFLSNSNVVSVEGFVNFRLKELNDDLEEIVEESVQDYLLELEYAEFINMLKYYISIQCSKCFLAEVEYGDEILIYGDGKNVTLECLNGYNDELMCSKTNIDDFVLNSLIILAPKRIVIKEKRNLKDEFKKTLLGIFGDKLKITTE